MSDAFKDALNSSLAESKKTPPKKKKKEVVEETFGGGSSYIPTGMNTSVQGQLKGQHFPHAMHTDIKTRLGNDDIGLNIQARSETDAPPRFPYPLETVLDHFADAYCALKNVTSQIIAAEKNPGVSKAQIEELESIKTSVNNALKDVTKFADRITKISLD